MKLSKNALSSFGVLQTLAKVSVIAFNEKLLIQYMNSYTKELLGLSQTDSLLGTSIKQLNLPLSFNDDQSESQIILMNNLFQRWQKITFSVDNETWSILLGFPITTKENLSEILAENENSENKICLSKIIQHLPELVYWKDNQYVYQGCNQHVAELLHLSSPKDIVGKTDYDFGWTDERIKSLQDVDISIVHQGINSIVEDIIPVNGVDRIFLTSKTPLRDIGGKIIGLLGISTDITNLKNMEESLRNAQRAAEAASCAKTEFLENMRHDIRTPLTGIVGFADILKSEAQNPQIKEYAENLVASSHALLDLMDEVLEAIRVSSGEIPLLKKKFDLHLMLNQVVNLHKAKASEKNLQLNFIYDNHLPQYVIGDKIRLHRIILELISNALNFTHEGHVTLTAELAKNEEQRLIIRLEVTDSGIGIDKDKQQDIYLQFKRLTPSYQGLYKGAGLGLYIVKQFIDELNAEIYVNSTKDEGTKFTCIIPLKAPLLNDNSGVQDDEASLEEKRLLPSLTNRASSSPSTDRPNKVLVVEDNPIAQKVALTLLSSMNCQVDVADSGQVALKQIKSNRYDLIFMDIGLGGGADGYEVTQQIRSLEKDKEHTPIVALTAHAAEENKQHCIEAGMDAVLSKPITKTHASNILNHFVRNPESYEREKKAEAKLDLPDTEEELFSLNQFPLLEVEQTLKNLGNKSVFIELLQDLIEVSIPQDFPRMKDAFAAKNYEQVEKLAHKMKSGAVYVGTTRMKYACQYLERYWKSGQQALFEKLYEQTVSVIEETTTFVKDWLKLDHESL
ncbi:sensory histidine-kinase / response regulator [Legionella nautarum]|uniref:histidine kinase n=1 Tax=Legionella nautarum TaxID=45070 RepID=A0A0W0X160_9GAMM|nr:PAS domain-containing sensor histidine kinase [Legionella nautarum]KTD38336.1 sensory histidine-kinase / response regulator [Legionella nautarum]